VTNRSVPFSCWSAPGSCPKPRGLAAAGSADSNRRPGADSARIASLFDRRCRWTIRRLSSAADSTFSTFAEMIYRHVNVLLPAPAGGVGRVVWAPRAGTAPVKHTQTCQKKKLYRVALFDSSHIPLPSRPAGPTLLLYVNPPLMPVSVFVFPPCESQSVSPVSPLPLFSSCPRIGLRVPRSLACSLTRSLSPSLSPRSLTL
jgi:hypothetical protein